MVKKKQFLTVLICLLFIGGCYNENIDENMTPNDVNLMNVELEKEEDKLELDNLTEGMKNKKQEYMNKLINIEVNQNQVNYKHIQGDISNAELGESLMKSFEDYDEVLNDIYNDLKIYLSNKEFEELEESQLQWLAEKDSTEESINEYNTENQVKGGYMHLYSELGNLTKKRCYDLLEYIEVEEIESTNEAGIEEVINYLYETLSTSKDEVMYVFSPNDNYVSDSNFKKDYYIFQINSYVSDGMYVSAEYNILVSKENREIYYYYPNGDMEQIK